MKRMSLEEAANTIAWDDRWGKWLAQMPVEVAKEIVKLRVPLQDALALLAGNKGEAPNATD